MIGTHSTAGQATTARIVRIIGAGCTVATAMGGVVLCFFLGLVPPEPVGCIVESGPDVLCSVIVAGAAILVALLLAAARTTTSPLIGSLLLAAFATQGGDDFSMSLGFLLAFGMLIIAIVAKCIEEFPVRLLAAGRRD
ncbi:hypothetical protein ACQBAU_03585 [Propionibacteriaceae bacterium Y2011]|uniref:hypothetical protein n=1 Tax=Microlunatus sp. Y2014 TaxID=3418488 RepID=UPI003B45FB82